MKIRKLKFDSQGLIPVIAQDVRSGKVLMQAYANEEALQKTVKTGKGTYYSRSRKALWEKGETSGNIQEVVDIRVDCDADSVLYLVRQTGPACHTGSESCFYRDGNLVDKNRIFPYSVLSELEAKIGQRKQDLPEGSYVASLFQKGANRIFQKVGEEAVETVLALKDGEKGQIVYESADLIFHLLVALAEVGVPLEAIQDELIRRYK